MSGENKSKLGMKTLIYLSSFYTGQEFTEIFKNWFLEFRQNFRARSEYYSLIVAFVIIAYVKLVKLLKISRLLRRSFKELKYLIKIWSTLILYSCLYISLFSNLQTSLKDHNTLKHESNYEKMLNLTLLLIYYG